MNTERVITMQDLRKQRICSWGVLYFLKDNGLTLQDLAKGRITVQTLLDYNNEVSNRIVENLDK